jgi:hypothetical protein
MCGGRYGAQLTDPNITCVGYRKAAQGCIGLTNFTQYAYRALFDEVINSFPGVDGLVGTLVLSTCPPPLPPRFMIRAHWRRGSTNGVRVSITHAFRLLAFGQRGGGTNGVRVWHCRCSGTARTPLRLSTRATALTTRPPRPP